MDPYLLSPELWSGVRWMLLTRLSDALNARLPRRAVAHIAERRFVTGAKRLVYSPGPDGRFLFDDWEPVGLPQKCWEDPWIVAHLEIERYERFIEVTDLAERRVITTIDIRSHANRTAGHPAEAAYQRSRREALTKGTFFLELNALAGFGFFARLYRRNDLHTVTVGLARVRERLPDVDVPQLEDEQPIRISLQDLLDQCYDRGAFDRQIDYRHDPEVNLSAEDAAWADALLRERGLRPNPAGGAT
jgi:hypothetical protein